jgi:multiple sugar transport system ATP-binding protein
MPELSLRNVYKVFPDGVQAVTDFCLDIEPGEFIVLVGPSGCGKTTVLRMIAGLETVTRGDIYLRSRRINQVAAADRGVSMVFQDYALYQHLSVYQNLGFSQIVRHENPDAIHTKVMAAAEMVELKHHLNRYPKQLSGGQRQRVALGRSVVSSAGVILMDEPLCNLDAKLRVQARREIKKLHHRLANTFIYVTHDQTEAMTMADRVVIMDQGCIQQVGAPGEVYLQPENMFVGGFIGNPAMSFVAGRIEACDFIANGARLHIPPHRLDGMAHDLRQRRPQGEVILGVRPEHFSAEPKAGSQAVRGEALAAEFLGNRTLVYFQIAGQPVVASLSDAHPYRPGDCLQLFLDLSQAHFFDPDSGRRIRPEGGEL